MPRDPIAPKRRRKRRIAKKLDRRCGMMRFRGGSYERFARYSRRIGEIAAQALNRLAIERLAQENAPSPWTTP